MVKENYNIRVRLTRLLLIEYSLFQKMNFWLDHV